LAPHSARSEFMWRSLTARGSWMLENVRSRLYFLHCPAACRSSIVF
jgi:hypothetical protein